jgi:O-antigen/teichoic acid export membrane protein
VNVPTSGDSIVSASPRVSRNIAANFIGTLWTALMGFGLISVYVRLLGIEAYGLVGILTTLQAAFTLLDLGLSTATNRELARLSVRAQYLVEARDLVRTMEAVYWAIAAIIAIIVTASAPFLADHWVRAQTLSADTVRQAFLIMGVILACQFPFALYSGGLIGLQRQVLLNGITVAAVTVRSVGAVLLLAFISRTIQAFFLWQLIATVLQTGATAFFLWRSLSGEMVRPRFRRAIIHHLWRFAAGMMGISFFALLLTQVDKVILSRLLTLEKFGYYTLAAAVAASLYAIVTPVFTAVFPRFSQLVASGNEKALRTLYHQSCQFVSVLLLPAALVVAFFAREILQLWTREPSIVTHTHLLLSLLITGTALNGLMSVPYALQLSTGWTRLALYQNVIAVALLMPLLVWSARRYGAIGAAAIWVIVNAGYVLIGIQVMHTRLLRSEKRAWYTRDVGLPLAGALSVALVGRWLFPAEGSAPLTIATLALVSLSTLVAAAMLTPLTRTWLRKKLFQKHSPEETYAD